MQIVLIPKTWIQTAGPIDLTLLITTMEVLVRIRRWRIEVILLAHNPELSLSWPKSEKGWVKHQFVYDSQLLSSIVPDNSSFIFCETSKSTIVHPGTKKGSNCFDWWSGSINNLYCSIHSWFMWDFL